MGKKKAVKLSKILLEIEDKKIELTLKQAEALQELLNETFGVVEKEYIDRWHYDRPYYYPWTTTTITPSPAIQPWVTYCSSDLAGGNVTSDTMVVNIEGEQITTSGYCQAA